MESDHMKFLICFLIIFNLLIFINVKTLKADEPIIGEIESLRTENQKVFRLSNGNYEYRYYLNKIHEFDGQSFININNMNNNYHTKEISYIYLTDVMSSRKIKQSFDNAVSISDTTLRNDVNINDNKKINYNQYLLSSNGYYIFPTSKEINSLNSKITYEYDYDVLLNSNIQYPLLRTNESYTFDDSLLIRDKYIIKGLSDVYDTSYLLAGKDRFQITGPNYSLIYPEYVSIMEIYFPKINPDYIVSYTFNMEKNYATNRPDRNPSLTLKRVTNCNYDDIDGTTNYYTSTLNNYSGSLSSYSFDIKDSMIYCLENNIDKLVLALEGDNTGYASFYSANASSTFSPYFSFVVTENALGGTLYGTAPVFNKQEDIVYNEENCLGYVMEKGYYVGLTLTGKMEETVINDLINVFYANGFMIRFIDSYDSDIAINERRIVFKYDINDLEDFHFVMQNSDGTWSGKNGTNGFYHRFDKWLTPDDQAVWLYPSSLTNKKPYYIAIREV